MRLSYATAGLASLTLTLGLSAPACPAQSSCMPGHTMPMASPAALPAPVRMTGIGNGDIAISSTSPEAKLWFTQGLNLLHDFWDYESVRAFEQSVKADPDCAMCWWGLHQAESFRGTDDKRAKEALDRARKLARHATKPEKLYIEAAYQADKQKPAKHDDESQSHKDSKETKTLRKLVALSPDDVQAKIFLAGSLRDGYRKNGEPRPGSAEGNAILAEVLRTHPDDSAANHYWIHAMEPSNHPELALDASRKLGALAPASGHMVHMPGHIFYRTGDYELARLSFEGSLHVDENYMDTQHVSPNDDWNYVHNMMYLIADLVEAGRIAQATETSAKLNHARGDSTATMYAWSTRDGMTRLNVGLPVVLRSGAWPQAIAMLESAQPDKDLPNLAWLRDAMLAYTRGMGALQSNNAAEASKQLDALNALLAAKPEEHKMTGMPMPAMAGKDMVRSSAHGFLDVAAYELKGALLTAQNKPAEADAAFQKATDANTALGYHEPPSYLRPVGETRGDALLRIGRLPEARLAYEDALKDRPNSGYAFYGLAQVAIAQHDDQAAAAAYQSFLASWLHADATLPQMAVAQAWVRGHGNAAAE